MGPSNVHDALKEIEFYAEKNADAPMKWCSGEGAFSPHPTASFLRPKTMSLSRLHVSCPRRSSSSPPSQPAVSHRGAGERMSKPPPGFLLSASTVQRKILSSEAVLFESLEARLLLTLTGLSQHWSGVGTPSFPTEGPLADLQLFQGPFLPPRSASL